MNPHYNRDKADLLAIANSNVPQGRKELAFFNYFDNLANELIVPDPENDSRINDIALILIEIDASVRTFGIMLGTFRVSPRRIRNFKDVARISQHFGLPFYEVEEEPAEPELPGPEVLDGLENLCDEFMGWLNRMRRRGDYDPKNHPTREQLRERDAILTRIHAAATPAVIMQLVKFAKVKRGDV